MAGPYHFESFASDPRIAALLDPPRHRVEHPLGLLLGQGHDDEVCAYPQDDHEEVRALDWHATRPTSGRSRRHRDGFRPITPL